MLNKLSTVIKCENDFYYYEYEDSDGSMVGVLGINFPSFVDTHVDDFLRNDEYYGD